MANSSKSKAPSLPTLTSSLNEKAQQGMLTQKLLKDLLQERRPKLAQQLAADAKRPDLFAAWGTSSNIDAGAKTSTVDPLLLQLLSDWVKQPFDPELETANAGLLHTYGYLLSNLKTPFGFKRARWCNGNLERGLGLPRGYLSPEPKTGTLLSNLTDFTAAVFADYLPAPLAVAGEAPLDPSQLSGFTLIEEIQDPAVSIYTRILSFANAPEDPKAEMAALFYAVKTADSFEFITVFPVSSWMMGKIRKSAGKAEAQIKTRYNAVVSPLGNEAHTGSTRLEAWPQGS